MDVKIPTVGESITSGLISAWHKKDGESVQQGDILLTLETDKVSSEIPAESSGILHIKAAEGQEVKIGEIVATIDATATDTATATPAPAAAKKKAPKPESPVTQPAPVAPAPVPAPEPPPEPETAP